MSCVRSSGQSSSEVESGQRKGADAEDEVADLPLGGCYDCLGGLRAISKGMLSSSSSIETIWVWSGGFIAWWRM